MKGYVAALVLLTACGAVVNADYDCQYRFNGFTQHWDCTFACCFDYVGCCYNYWYGWTGGSLFILACLCLCAGCGGYRYRRSYVIRHNSPAYTTVSTVNTTTARTGLYQPQAGYQTGPPPAYK